MATGKIIRSKKSSKKLTDKIMPREFSTLDIIVRGQEILVDMRELMEISNCDNKAEIVSAMNKAASYFFYFGRVRIDLKEALQKEQENFSIWFARKKHKFESEKSEKARERRAMVKYRTEYAARKIKIMELTRYADYAKIARSSLEKNIGLIQSIGAMVRSDEKPKAVNPGDEGEEN